MVSLLDPRYSQKSDSNWKKWLNFCRETGIRDEFLQIYSKQQRIDIMCGFSVAIRRNFFGKSKKEVLHGNTAQSTVRHVHQIFRINGFNDPAADKTGVKHLKICRIMNAYKKEDPNIRNQFALPLSIFKLLYFNRITPKNKHIGLLATGALFYGMRPCEYLKVKNADQKQTKLLKIENFNFF